MGLVELPDEDVQSSRGLEAVLHRGNLLYDGDARDGVSRVPLSLRSPILGAQVLQGLVEAREPGEEGCPKVGRERDRNLEPLATFPGLVPRDLLDRDLLLELEDLVAQRVHSGDAEQLLPRSQGQRGHGELRPEDDLLLALEVETVGEVQGRPKVQHRALARVAISDQLGQAREPKGPVGDGVDRHDTHRRSLLEPGVDVRDVGLGGADVGLGGPDAKFLHVELGTHQVLRLGLESLGLAKRRVLLLLEGEAQLVFLLEHGVSVGAAKLLHVNGTELGRDVTDIVVLAVCHEGEEVDVVSADVFEDLDVGGDLLAGPDLAGPSVDEVRNEFVATTRLGPDADLPPSELWDRLDG